MKRASSVWAKQKSTDPEMSGFQWQAGYGVFSVSSSSSEEVIRYISNQEEHHRVKTFQEEYLMFLKKHDVATDLAYLWD